MENIKTREIKFRAFLAHTNEMVNVKDMEFDRDGHEKGTISIMYNMTKSGQCVSDIEGEYKKEVFLMQYTGLKDKNGKEIYEGDIVKYTVHTGSDCTEDKRPDLWNKGIIRFGEGEVDASDYEEYVIPIIGFYIESGEYPAPPPLTMIATMEVIGNIYENKELLNGQQ